MEGRWDLALNDYRWLTKQYETTAAALTAPIYIANYYAKQNNLAVAQKAYNEAITHYQNIIHKYPQSIIAALAHEQIANCFIAQKQWEEAIKAVSSIKNVLDNNTGRISTYLLLGNIYESSGQLQLAVKVYSEFVNQFPQHPLVPPVKEKIRMLMNS
jgi:tetratricopeptide (TPR) repeat protein